MSGSQSLFPHEIFVMLQTDLQTNRQTDRDRQTVPAKWGRTHMGSDGLNRILTGFYLFGPARVRPVPGYGLHPPKHMISRDFD